MPSVRQEHADFALGRDRVAWVELGLDGVFEQRHQDDLRAVVNTVYGGAVSACELEREETRFGVEQVGHPLGPGLRGAREGEKEPAAHNRARWSASGRLPLAASRFGIRTRQSEYRPGAFVTIYIQLRENVWASRRLKQSGSTVNRWHSEYLSERASGLLGFRNSRSAHSRVP